MSPEAQRNAIAALLGITDIRMSERWEVTEPPDDPVILIGVKQGLGKLAVPDYLNDLNAMHEAEKILTPEQLETYGSQLSHLSDNLLSLWCPEFKEVAAAAMVPANKRAEALLKTLNLWDDSK